MILDGSEPTAAQRRHHSPRCAEIGIRMCNPIVQATMVVAKSPRSSEIVKVGPFDNGNQLAPSTGGAAWTWSSRR